MSGLYVSLNDRIVTRGEIRIPRGGRWDADIDVQDPATVSASPLGVSLVLAGLTLKGTLFRGAPWHGVYRGRIVAGAGGWPSEIGPKGYRALVGGVKASTVLRDAAREVGETIDLATDFSVGMFYARERGPASRLLGMFDLDWRIRPDGVTTTAARDTSSIASHFDVIAGSPELGIYTVATEHPEDFMPGRHFASAVIPDQEISAVIHRIEAGEVRTEVWV